MEPSQAQPNLRQRIKAQGTSPAPASPAVDSKKGPNKPPRAPFDLHPAVAFLTFFAAHAVGAWWHPIQDCDETFNYWEPTHYLTHNHGFQTWEYSPEFALRSWLYTGLHALVTLPVKLTGNKTAEFYALRLFLGFICAVCETTLFSKISALFNPRVAVLFLVIMSTSSGMFHASVAYLPSSFSMYATMLGMASFMDWRGGLRTSQGIFWIGAGAVLGWPFAAALAIPFLLEELLFAIFGDDESRRQCGFRFLFGTVRVLLVLAVQFPVDNFFYRRLVSVPLQLVYYNLFSGKGPDLYGTEPWHFYLRNLFLNFHVDFLLALAAGPLLLMQQALRAKGTLKAGHIRGIVFVSPFYLWLAIFSAQPHKEERFMAPAYPALALNAAISLHIILANIGSTDKRDVVSKIPIKLRLAGISTFFLAALALSAWRTIGTITAFNAPLTLYEPLHQPGMVRSGDIVCLGKEWYRFPTHYLLPDTARARFIRSDFHGLLPGKFSEIGSDGGFGWFPGAWLIPTGMNDENREDMSKYADMRQCAFLVDSRLPSAPATPLQPDYIADLETWERVQCLPFLDTAATGLVGRLGWIPDRPWVPSALRRVWGEQCLLKRRKKQGSARVNPVPKIETMG